jgi:hypothetical protein
MLLQKDKKVFGSHELIGQGRKERDKALGNLNVTSNI